MDVAWLKKRVRDEWVGSLRNEGDCSLLNVPRDAAYVRDGSAMTVLRSSILRQ